MNSRSGPIAALLAAGLALAPLAAFAQEAGSGGLLVTPTRLVFEGRRRSAEITVINRGTAEATYRISFVRMAMDESGRIAEVAEPPAGLAPADGLLRFSPRQFTLPAAASQTVRLQVRKPAELAAGEYRSHLTVRLVPPSDAGPDPLAEPGRGRAGFQVRLVPVFGVSVPVIVRHGDLVARVRLGEPAILPPGPDGAAALRLRLHREGDRSVYGHLRVVHRAADGRSAEVGALKGVAVYTPLAERAVEIPLRPPAGWTLRGGQLQVEYDDAEGGGATLARADFSLP